MGGRPKALLRLPSGETFIERIAHSFFEAGVDDVVIVLGHEAEAIQAALERDRVPGRVVFNDRFSTGQFSSVLAGLDAIDRPGVTAMLMTLVDVPLVSVATIRAVVQRFKETGAPIVRPVRGDDHGHPVLIARALFGALRISDPAAGAKPVVRASVSPAGDVPVTDAGAFRDVDTEAEYEGLLASGREE